jgi:uncharacterized OsmC-like protein
MTQVLDRIRNGVDSARMYGTLDAIKENPALGSFQFRAHNHWSFFGAGQEDGSRAEAFTVDAGEPAVLLGFDTGPNPAEHLLHALAVSLTTTLVYVATARKIRLTEVSSTLEGDMDVRGCLGLTDDARNGFTSIRVSFKLKGDAPAKKLREIVERAQARSAVLDMVNHGVPVEVTVEA